MLKSQIMKGDDSKEWGQQLKEEFVAKAKSLQHSKPSIHFIFTICSLSIHPLSFLNKKKSASSPFSQSYTSPFEP